MDWNRRNREDGQALKRIVAMLFALADLADRAGSRSRPVRRFVLWMLRPVEAVAWEFVLEAEHGAPVLPAPTLAPRGDSPADAMHLAQTFRALAAMLDSLPAQAFAIWRAGRRRTGCRVSPLDALDRFRHQVFRRSAFQAPARPCPDTS